MVFLPYTLLITKCKSSLLVIRRKCFVLLLAIQLEEDFVSVECRIWSQNSTRSAGAARGGWLKLMRCLGLCLLLQGGSAADTGCHVSMGALTWRGACCCTLAAGCPSRWVLHSDLRDVTGKESCCFGQVARYQAKAQAVTAVFLQGIGKGRGSTGFG